MLQNVLRPADLFLDAARLTGGAVVPGAARPLPLTAPITDAAATDTAVTDPVVSAGPVERPAPPPGTGEEKPLKRTYQIRPDQDRALAVALAKQQLGRGRGPWGRPQPDRPGPP